MNPKKNTESTKNIESTKNTESTKNIESTKNTESTKNIENTHTGTIAGHAATALKLVLKKSYPSYGYMFYNKNEPATSLWELWDSDRGSPTMDSRNHVYSASISTFLFKHLGGIQAASAGYDRVLVAPFVVLDDANVTKVTNANVARTSVGDDAFVTTVEATVGTPHGTITSSWTTTFEPSPPSPPSPPPPPAPPSCLKPVKTCAMQEEGSNGPESASLCVGCTLPNQVIGTSPHFLINCFADHRVLLVNPVRWRCLSLRA
jgi:hypothetical protein